MDKSFGLFLFFRLFDIHSQKILLIILGVTACSTVSFIVGWVPTYVVVYKYNITYSWSWRTLHK